MKVSKSKLEQLKEHIRIQLTFCDKSTTPKLCEILSFPENYEKIEKMIIRYVAETGMRIDQAILQVEKDYNPNIIED